MALSEQELTDLLLNVSHINNKLSNGSFLKKLGGDALSFTAVKLAAMKASLVDMKADAHKDMLDLEVAKDKAKAIAYAKAKVEHGSTAASDIKYSDSDFIKAQNEYNEAKVQFEKLKTILMDAHDMIDAIKSRVIDQQQERKDAKIG